MIVNNGLVLIQIGCASAHRHYTRNHLAVFIAHHGGHLDVLFAASLSPSEFARNECQVKIVSYVSWHDHFGKSHFTSNRHVALDQVWKLVLDLKHHKGSKTIWV